MGANAKVQPRWFTIEVSGQSMLPTLKPGDYLLLKRTDKFKSGQIVLLEDSEFRLVIKRLSAITNGQWQVLGDNPELSRDSRIYGLVKPDQIKAVVVARYWPWPKLITAHV